MYQRHSPRWQKSQLIHPNPPHSASPVTVAVTVTSPRSLPGPAATSSLQSESRGSGQVRSGLALSS